MANLPDLQDRWKYLYHEYLPSLAKAKDSVQPKWPVYLDHCFARIVLDNAVGKDKPWTEVVKQPAIKNMTEVQLGNAIELAERVATGEADLVVLNERSLELRGKSKPANGRKRKLDEDDDLAATKKKARPSKNETMSSYFLPSPASPNKKASPNPKPKQETSASPSLSRPDVDISHQLHRIQTSNLTPFRKQTLALLLQIPAGRYSTYGALSDHISAKSHKTCARAVGSSMRNNPFAPEVPCHRILAGDGSLGGFKGDWGEQGKHAKAKHDLLREEGVRFDSTGKVKGPPFRDFT